MSYFFGGGKGREEVVEVPAGEVKAGLPQGGLAGAGRTCWPQAWKKRQTWQISLSNCFPAIIQLSEI